MNDIENNHYAAPGLVERITAGLAKMGKTPDTVTMDDLAQVDEFHIRGPGATADLIKLLAPPKDARILDLGSGLGGPARRLVAATECRVTGVDLSDDYGRAANTLSRWVGLEDKLDFRTGDVTALTDFENDSFDGAWTIHVAMNIENKAAFYAEVARVLKPKSRFVVYDIIAADDEPEIAFPMPWATDPADSFLVTEKQLTALITDAGFEINQVIDQTDQGLGFIEETIRRIQEMGGPPPLSLATVLGPVFQQIMPNLLKNLKMGKLRIIGIVCQTP